MKTVAIFVALFAVAAATTEQWNTQAKSELQKPTHVVGSSPVDYTTTYATGSPVQWNGHQWTQWDDQNKQWNTVPVTRSWNTNQQATTWNNWNTNQQPQTWNSNWNQQPATGAQSRSLWDNNNQNTQHSSTWNGNNWNTAVPVARSSWTSGTPSHVWTGHNNWNTVPVARSAWSPSTWAWNTNTATVPAWSGNSWNTNTYASNWPWTYYVAA